MTDSSAFVSLSAVSQFYARVHVTILDSSIAEDFRTRHIFEDFLKVCSIGEDGGVVDMTRAALARRFNVPIDELNFAITKLEAPDPQSRDQAFEGRRLHRLDEHRDWGWKIINWPAYDKLRTRADAAARLAKHRAKKGSEQPESPKEDKWHKDTRTVLHLLNEATGKHFRETESSCGVISARLSEPGVELEGVKKMIERQCRCWKGGRLGDYLQPSTLFGKEKFDNYYAARDQPVVLTDQPPGKHDRNAGTYNAMRLGQYSNVGKNLNPEPPPA